MLSTWKCHICGRDRPDANISVRTHGRDINGVYFNENVRYCNDDPECIEKSKTFSFLDDLEDR